nr:EAL domain-containing protein [uncultured Rhodoferax sp.]
MIAELSLLLIDDDELDRHAITRTLRKSPVPCEVTYAETAAAGLEMASSKKFDAILLDYRLPDDNGLEVLRTLRGGAYDGVAVVMLSRYENESLAEQCLEAGAQDFLLKDEVNSRHLTRVVMQARQRFQIEERLRYSLEQVRNLSEHDALTGLMNRRGFERALEAQLARARRRDGRLAILLLDLDDFKSINDTMGHDAGDQLLVEVARRLTLIARDGGLLCRLGGDEFVVMMTSFDHDEQAIVLADRINATLRESIFIGSTEQTITTSIGIAVLGNTTDNAADLLKYADLAMYQAKLDGRNKSRFYSVSLQEAVQFRSLIKNDLQRALEKDELKIYYQPQIRSADGGLRGMEALLRWHHPRLGVLSPAAFLAIAEETGLIVDIGAWVLHEGCRQLKVWRERYAPRLADLTLAINLSAVQIKQEKLPRTVMAALAEHNLPANCLELEITESMLIEVTSTTVSLLSEISAQGVAMSLDDFGTGYSSLDHLKLFPISILKIDKGFVSAVGEGGKSEKLFVAIIAFAKALNMQIVVEGVETQAQAAFCTEQSCDLLQGYFYSKPLPAHEFEATFLAAPTQH